VDGPEFDGHEVDFEELMQRLQAYTAEEAAAYGKYKGEGKLA
jgi:ferredoxin--NADP+ reductase